MDMWASLSGSRVVEELETEEEDDDDTDTQGIGLASASHGNRRLVSDQLRFTGIDMGDRRAVRSRGARPRPPVQEEETSEESSEETSESSDDGAELSLDEREEALVASALERIRRAQAKGKKEVKLNKEELAALEKRRRRMREEARRKNGNASSSSERRRQQRFAVPLSQLEPISRKPRRSEEALAAHPSPADPAEASHRHQALPPLGYFPPPSASRAQARSSTNFGQSQRQDRSRGSSPFSYSRARDTPPASTARHVSDTAARGSSRPRSHGRVVPYPEDDDVEDDEDWGRTSRTSQRSSRGLGAVDPFQYQTGGPRVSQYVGVAPANIVTSSGRRYVSGPPDVDYRGDRPPVGRYYKHDAPPAAARGRGRRSPSTEETTEEEKDDDRRNHGNGEASRHFSHGSHGSESTSDSYGQGATIHTDPPSPIPTTHPPSLTPGEGRISAGGASGSGTSARDAIVVEEEPSRRPPSRPVVVTTTSSRRDSKDEAKRLGKKSSPTKKKPAAAVGSGSGNGGSASKEDGRRRKK